MKGKGVLYIFNCYTHRIVGGGGVEYPNLILTNLETASWVFVVLEDPKCIYWTGLQVMYTDLFISQRGNGQHHFLRLATNYKATFKNKEAIQLK